MGRPLGRWLFLIGLGGAILAGLAPQPAFAHGLPTNYIPAPNAVLSAPPTIVRISFSEPVNPAGSKLTVVDPANRALDKGDTHAIGNDGKTLVVDLPLLPPGTYVVGWRSLSADDGHVTGGSYLFHIARADGTVPPVIGNLPSGNIIGGGGSTPATPLDLPSLLAAISHWVALLALTLVLGIIFWWLFVMPRQRATSTVQAAIRERLPQVADLALETIIVATIAEVIAQAMVLGGSWQGAISWPTLSALLGSQFGTFMIARVVLSLIGLLGIWLPPLRKNMRQRRRAMLSLCFALVLAITFVFSGHGGATSTLIGPAVDMAHLLANGVWLGGLFVLALIVLPVLLRAGSEERARYLSTSIPAFSIPALFGVALLAVTGPLNASVRMTRLDQLWTTPYGLILLIKIGLFLVMAAISYAHVYQLRPQLAARIEDPDEAIGSTPGTVAPPNVFSRIEHGLHQIFVARPRAFPAALAVVRTSAGPATDGSAMGGVVLPPAGATQPLVPIIVGLMRAEATLGLLVLLCSALLAPLAGTLAPRLPAASAAFGAAGGPQTLSGTVDGIKVLASLAPGRFGTNQLTITITNPDGRPAAGGSVFVLADMIEMDMGTNQFTLSTNQTPGHYVGDVDLPMAGHWKIEIVLRTLEDPQNLHRIALTFEAGL